ncbi:hypothetical protein AN964_23550 [Heyndrickxia shackletonii]|uniref:Group-specific protein n=1 Tax=Heyndrickxia shackletonii TaxID=157838 RepID=A0A0Q3TAP9_9BACI|nr:hypothetical protein [Heyndrickxia shackletonii]KQL50625.1 hypothetical protein AN964_23550 [Heyndrickxia shackletonii]NEY98061.1 hypothetical protein [Heyndrickxia shackletonii]
MIKKLFFSFLLLFLTTTNASAQTNKQIEIYDIGKERVVKKVPMSADIQEDVKRFLERTTSVYPKVKPIPSRGFMIKVPLEPAVEIRNQWLHGRLNQVILVFPPKEHPFYLVMDEKNRTHLFLFEGETNTLLRKLNYKPRGY